MHDLVLMNKQMNKVRVRFAPSPTGALHIGGIRTALYNYLLAKKTGGTMILRIEDTDQSRYVPGAEDYILQSLEWAGIKIDEGFGIGGPHAPYRQSERKEIYQKYAQQLADSDYAYYAFDTEVEINDMRERLKASGSSSLQYDAASRMQMRNSLTVSNSEAVDLIKKGSYVIRIKVPENEEVRLTDLIRGDVHVQSAQIDDKVLLKSDGMPTYHLANVVDDYVMKITHVIRGEEWLPSAPLHVLLYKYLGWQNEMPQFAHLPLLLKPDGNGKLSKRAADQMGFPIFPLNWTDPESNELAKGFRESGYLPEALINFLAFLGWNPGTEQEIFSMADLIEAFSIERIGKAGAKFDIQKAQWFNQQYLRAKPDEELAGYLLDFLKKKNIVCTIDKAKKISVALRDRITFPADLHEMSKLFFEAPTSYDEKITSKKWNDETAEVLSAFAQSLNDLTQIDSVKAKELLDETAASLGSSSGKVLQVLRVILTGGTIGPDLMTIIEILGPEETAQRIQLAIVSLSK